MSEERKVYTTGCKDPIKQLQEKGCFNTFYDGFSYPTPEEIKAIRTHLGLSQTDMAKIVGATFKEGKGSQTIRKWETQEGKPEHRKIPYATWRLFTLETGLAKVNNIT